MAEEDTQSISVGSDADNDSAYAESLESDSISLRSWINEYREENGRTYHAFKDGAYWGANDEAALQHLDIGHALYTRTFGGNLFLAPIEPNASNILDLGTGTGIWAIDVADEYPQATVLGTDLSPSQPTWVPPNCKFMVDDAEAEFPWADNTYDFVHIRGLHGAIQDWPRLYRQCLRILKPGGYLEQSEYSISFGSDDNTIPEDNGIAGWNKVGFAVHDVLKTELQILDTIEEKIGNAGFTDIVGQNFKWPIGPWPKDKQLKVLGRLCRAHIDSGLENWTLRLVTTVLGWTAEEVYVLCANVRQDITNPKVHAIHEMKTVYARKPI